VSTTTNTFNPDKYIRHSKSSHTVPRIVCADGFVMSVQASHMHYCKPRNDDGPYTHFEVGYPSQACDKLMPYAEDPNNPTDTVYGMVPRAVIEAVVAQHGGVIDPIAEIARLRATCGETNP
jgi:hypothetical protein